MELCFHSSCTPSHHKGAPCQYPDAAYGHNGLQIIYFSACIRYFDKYQNNSDNGRNNNPNDQNGFECIQILGNNTKQVCNQNQVIAGQWSHTIAEQYKISKCTECPDQRNRQYNTGTFSKQQSNGKRSNDDHHITKIRSRMTEQKFRSPCQ